MIFPNRELLSTQDIKGQVQDIYGATISLSTVSAVTNKLLDNIHEWQKHPLEAVYMVTWIDTIMRYNE